MMADVAGLRLPDCAVTVTVALPGLTAVTVGCRDGCVWPAGIEINVEDSDTTLASLLLNVRNTMEAAGVAKLTGNGAELPVERARLAGTTMSADACTVNGNEALAMSGGLLLSLTVTVTMPANEPVGVPVMAPEDGFRVRGAGRPLADQVSGVVALAAVRIVL